MTPAEAQAAVRATALRLGVPPDLADAVAYTESRYRQSAVSRAGAIGIMQLMPATAEGLGVDPSDPLQNIEGGVRMLRSLHERFGEWPIALAAYVWGPGNVRRAAAEGRAWPQSVQTYVARVLARAGSPTPSHVASSTRAPTPGFALFWLAVLGMLAVGVAYG